MLHMVGGKKAGEMQCFDFRTKKMDKMDID